MLIFISACQPYSASDVGDAAAFELKYPEDGSTVVDDRGILNARFNAEYEDSLSVLLNGYDISAEDSKVEAFEIRGSHISAQMKELRGLIQLGENDLTFSTEKGSYSFKFFFDDHDPPHFHITYQEYEALVVIESGIVKGEMPRRALKLVFDWLDLHKDELIDNWKLIQETGEYKKIDPITQVLDIIKENNYATDNEISAIDKEVKSMVKECEKFAEESPFPDPQQLYDVVYEQEDYPFIS